MEVKTNGGNKGNLTPIPVDSYIITAGDVINYLKTQVLGFDFKCDFVRWRGMNDSLSYVRMRCAFLQKNILCDEPQTVVDKIVSANNLKFNESIVNSLKPFMYPNATAMRSIPLETLQRLQLRGVYGNRLEELMNYCEFKYNKEVGVFMLYLRPETIIADMLKDPLTNSINGHMSIVGVTGEDEQTIKWFAEIRKSGEFGLENISIDSVFNGKK